MDDIVITGSDSNQLNLFIDLFGREFDIKDLGDLSYFLGMEVTKLHTGLHVSQTKYAMDLLKRSSMLESKPYSTPIAAKVSLSLHDGELLSNPSEFRCLVGCLQ